MDPLVMGLLTNQVHTQNRIANLERQVTELV